MKGLHKRGNTWFQGLGYEWWWDNWYCILTCLQLHQSGPGSQLNMTTTTFPLCRWRWKPISTLTAFSCASLACPTIQNNTDIAWTPRMEQQISPRQILTATEPEEPWHRVWLQHPVTQQFHTLWLHTAHWSPSVVQLHEDCSVPLQTPSMFLKFRCCDWGQHSPCNQQSHDVSAMYESGSIIVKEYFQVGFLFLGLSLLLWLI